MRRSTSSTRHWKTPPSPTSSAGFTASSEIQAISSSITGDDASSPTPSDVASPATTSIARFGAETTTLPEYERAIKLDDGIVRHLITLFEHEVGAPPMSEEELAMAARRREADDDEDEE